MTLIANVGAEPELRSFPNGDAVCNIRVATTEKWRDKTTQEDKEHTEWHRVALFRRDAENAAKFLKTGSQVYIEGKLRTRKYNDKDGVERYVTEIHADGFQILGSRPEGASSGKPPAPAAAKKPDAAPRPHPRSEPIAAPAEESNKIPF